MDLRLSGTGGELSVHDFVQAQGDGPAGYNFRKGGFGKNGTQERMSVPSEKSPAALMFENFAAMVGNAVLFEASVAASERTQEWLDAIWARAMQNEADRAGLLPPA